MTDIERLCERLDAATKARFRQSTLDIADHEDSHVTVKLIKEASLALRQSEQKLREAEKERDQSRLALTLFLAALTLGMEEC